MLDWMDCGILAKPVETHWYNHNKSKLIQLLPFDTQVLTARVTPCIFTSGLLFINQFYEAELFFFK